MSAVVVAKKLHHDCNEGCRAVSKGSQGMQSWHPTRGCHEGTVRLSTHASLASSRLPTQTSQLEETVDEAIVVQVQDIPSVDLDDLGLSSKKTTESTWELSLLKNLFASTSETKVSISGTSLILSLIVVRKMQSDQ